MKKTRIIATYGPSIASAKKVGQLVEAGVNLFRINCSHGVTADFLKAARIIREGSKKSRYPVGLIMDIGGPKLRLGRFKGEIAVKPGQTINLGRRRSDPAKRTFEINYPEVLKAIQPKQRVFIDDGNIAFDVITASQGRVTLKARNSGQLSSGKGINLPDSKINLPTITAKDKDDIKTAVRLDADFIALSFVRSSDDIEQGRRLIKRWSGSQRLIAKLEKPEAIKRLDSIMRHSDGVLIARGDLGVEFAPEELPRLQKQIIAEANQHHIPVIVATQVLESMRFHPRATRAEINDVATAVYDFADGVMLSAETAVGQYPLEAVQTMRRVIETTEAHLQPPANPVTPTTEAEIAPSIADAVSRCQELCDAQLILAFTTSGFTVTLISKLFPAQPIIAITSEPRLQRQLSLCRSVYAVESDQPQSFDEMVACASQLCRRLKLARRGDKLIITGGVPFGSAHKTNMMMVHELKGGTQA
ncbi:MAG: pyruvate kinase [candidate division Zixibacteria bacterium]|nr:pyruvate kinase [candidate division Zixibacteria bacterium]MDH3936804.1 pyruvate kinase [candidate division Zixibacteria bacterium]MDH4033211.1 pyruvate kinase [candidate division Zixibacteria bacterium]